MAETFAVTLTLHVPVPAQDDPLQPKNEYPLAGVAVKVTLVPELNDAEQVVPQLIPAGELVTVPVAAPEVVIVTEYCGGGAAAKVAVTDWLEFNVTLHVPVPLQAPLQPLNT